MTTPRASARSRRSAQVEAPKLTPRQARFVELYTDGPLDAMFNATLCAALVGYAWPDKQGPRLTTFPAVASAIRAGVLASLRPRGRAGACM